MNNISFYYNNISILSIYASIINYYTIHNRALLFTLITALLAFESIFSCLLAYCAYFSNIMRLLNPNNSESESNKNN